MECAPPASRVFVTSPSGPIRCSWPTICSMLSGLILSGRGRDSFGGLKRPGSSGFKSVSCPWFALLYNADEKDDTKLFSGLQNAFRLQSGINSRAAFSIQFPIQKAMRFTPSTKSKWVSLLNTGRECSRANAAIHASFVGIGFPSRFNSKQIFAYSCAVAEVTAAISVNGKYWRSHSS